MIETPYGNLKRHFAQIGTWSEVLALLHWDMDSIMPTGAAESRTEQIALLERQLHEMTLDPRLPGWLAEAETAQVDGLDRANMAEMRRRLVHATAVPTDLVEAFARARSKCSMVWRNARRDNDFRSMQPYLERVVELTREIGSARGAVLGRSPYDALVDTYDPGLSADSIATTFSQIQAFLPELTGRVIERQASEPAPLPLDGPFPAAAQERIARRVMAALGFDFTRGRLDTSLHPFCGGTPDDVRITTRYQEQDVFFGLLGVIHETGHALYELGLPVAWRRQPAGTARSMTLHESQSLLYEMQLGCSRPFLAFLAPILREELGVSGPQWEAENLYRLATRVRRGLIRIEADEVTYPAHVMLRFELERALIDGSLKVAELPGAWREGMMRTVGIHAPDDRDGCLQDIHWPEGLFGYFPTYTLGALTAAQLFESASASGDDVAAGVERGDFRPLLSWLREHVHQHASLRDGQEIVRTATGRPLDAQAFRAHLERRYLS